ncbi:MAG: response regulator [bacterium]|nr:response regulator [bacterium]
MDTGIKKKFILVGEDENFYANIYKVKLAKEGFEVQVVGDGEMLLKAARDKKPDLIILDLIMPVKDGFETLAELKADPELKNVKVVVCSNLGQQEDIKRAKEMGALEYLTKAGLSIQEMVDKIRGYVK